MRRNDRSAAFRISAVDASGSRATMCRPIGAQRMGADLDPITDAAAGARFIASPSFYRLAEPSFYHRSYPAPLVVVGTRDGARVGA